MHLRGDHVVLSQIHIPPTRPRRLGILPRDVVRVNNIRIGSHELERRNVRAVHVLLFGTRREGLGKSLGTLPVPDVSPRIFMGDGHGFDSKAHDAMSLFPLGIVIFQQNVDVVVQEGFLRIRSDEPDGESSSVVGLVLSGSGEANARPREVVDDPIVMVAVLDVRREGVCLDLGEGDLAEDLAVDFAEHVNGVGRILDFITRQEFAEVFGGHFGTAGGTAEGETVVVFGELSVNGSQRIHLHRNVLSRRKLMGANTGDIKSMASLEDCHGKDGCPRHHRSQFRHCGLFIFV
mmetsp:Transcript_11829/g.21858  ORF Transcript_11829/g.21858 Transcript_11829/m.21858 type:complete len:291 (-) Transcript_11829:122-994(-)